MDDLLKEAIADAKAVRETALENAKMALEEAFTPRLQSMLSQKIQTEMEDEDEVEELSYKEDDEDPSDEDSMAAEMEDEEDVLAALDEVPGEEEPAMEQDDEEMLAAQDEVPGEEDEEGVIEINGVKYARVVS